MSFFGWDERNSQLETGKFWCPTCRRDGTFALVESRKWFLRVFRAGLAGEPARARGAM